MLCNAPDATALDERLQRLQHKADDFALMLDIARRHNLSEVFPELTGYLLSQAETARAERRELLKSSLADARPDPFYEVSAQEAAETLLVSEATIRNWDVSGCPFDLAYPGRFRSEIFYQWARTYQSKREFNRQARKRAIALNRSV